MTPNAFRAATPAASPRATGVALLMLMACALPAAA